MQPSIQVSLTRRRLLGSSGVLGGAVLLAACQPNRAPTGSAPQAAPANAPSAAWDALVESARREGEVNVYSGVSARDGLVDAFEKKFSGMRVNFTQAQGAELIQRIIAERSAGKFIVDVVTGTSSSSVLNLKPINALLPLEPALLLPEVVDLAAWFENHFWWVDDVEPNTTFAFQGGIPATLAYNTNLVNPVEFTSFWDMLNPKWKGQIVTDDIRGGGRGGNQKAFFLRNPGLGPEFIRRIFGEMDIVLGRDHRQMTDWVADGTYPIGLNLFSTEINRAVGQGLPVSVIPHDQLKEGAYISPSSGTVNLAADPPHPNAAKLYVNWLLSRDGQNAWQDSTKEPSLRTDIPHEGLRPSSTPRPGVEYMDLTRMQSVDFGAEFDAIATAALVSVGRS